MPNQNDPFAEFEQAGQDFNYVEQPQAPAPQPAPAANGLPVPDQGDGNLEGLMQLVAGVQAPPQQPSQQQAGEPQGPGPIPYDRFQQVVEENRYMRGVLERALMGQMPSGQPQQPIDPNAVPEGVDPDVYGYVKPILDIERQRMMAEIQPALERIQREEAVAALVSRVPGFQPEMVDELEREFAALPPNEQQDYRGRGGAEALAYRVVVRRGASGGRVATSPATPAPGMARAHSISRSGGMLPPVQRPLDVNALTDEQFEALKAASMQRRFGSLSDNEPDPILDGRI